MSGKIGSVSLPTRRQGAAAAVAAGGLAALGLWLAVGEAPTADAAVAKPTVATVTPNKGSAVGDQVVAITGTGFKPGGVAATAVVLHPATGSDVAVTNFAVVSDNKIVATLDDAYTNWGAKAFTVTVTNSGGTNTTGAAYTAVAAPTISAVSPANGVATGGTPVTVTGTNLTGATIKLGGVNVPGVKVNVAGTQATFNTPPKGATDNAGVALDIVASSTGGSVTSAGAYTYKPVVASLSVAVGDPAGGDVVLVKGAGFNGTVFGGVAFNGAALSAAGSLQIVSDTEMVVKTPLAAGATAADRIGNVVVTNGTQSSATSAATKWSYLGVPTVTSVSANPDTGVGHFPVGNATFQINGSGFWGTTGVKFGGVAAKFATVASDTTLTVTIPANPIGLYDITVTNVRGTSAKVPAAQFQYLPAAGPQITSAAGSVDETTGGAILITGKNFTGVTCPAGVEVGKDGGTLAAVTSCTVLSDTQILAQVSPPNGALQGDSYTVKVTSKVNPAATRTAAFVLR